MDRTRTISADIIGQHIDIPDLNIADLVAHAIKLNRRDRYHTRLEHDSCHYFFKFESKPFSPAWWMKKTMARRSLECFEALCITEPRFKTPVQYFIWERYQFGFARAWAILTEYVEGTIPIYDYLNAGPDFSALESVVSQLGDHLGRLHRAGFISRAIDETNVLIKTDKDKEELWVIDLEHCKPLSKYPEQRLDDLVCAMMLLGHACPSDSHIWRKIFFQSYDLAADIPLKSEQKSDLLTKVVRQFQGKWGKSMGIPVAPPLK